MCSLTTEHWIEQQKITASDGAAEDQFGSSVALSGDTLAVGACTDTIGSNIFQGSAYIFVRNGMNWSLQQKLVASDGAAADVFGNSVALNGDTLAVGAPGSKMGQGAVYVFARSATSWLPLAILTASDAASKDSLGESLAISGNTVAVGASFDDIAVNPDQGSAYIFAEATCPTLTLSPASLPNSVRNTPYSYLVTASGGNGNYQFAVSNGALPPGLTLAANGMLSGTPTTVGTYQFAITATIPNTLCQGSYSYMLTIVNAACSPISITPAPLPAGKAGMNYAQQFYASGGSGPYNFAVIWGSLPQNVTLTPWGYLSGWPRVAGTYYFAVRATDANGCEGTGTYALTIR